MVNAHCALGPWGLKVGQGVNGWAGPTGAALRSGSLAPSLLSLSGVVPSFQHPPCPPQSCPQRLAMMSRGPDVGSLHTLSGQLCVARRRSRACLQLRLSTLTPCRPLPLDADPQEPSFLASREPRASPACLNANQSLQGGDLAGQRVGEDTDAGAR